MELRFRPVARSSAPTAAAVAATAAVVCLVLLVTASLCGAQRSGPPPPPGEPWRWFLTTEEPPRRQRPPRPRPTPTRQPTTTPRLVDVQGSPVNCPCPATNEYNPVCGSNGATYNSPVKLRCAQRCGYEVTLTHYGQCPRSTAAP